MKRLNINIDNKCKQCCNELKNWTEEQNYVTINKAKGEYDKIG